MADRGQLRVYLGAAPGVGKTYAMLGEARRRAGRGTDVVVGYVETHGRALTTDLPEVLADPALLERILANLATNAVRYSPVGEDVLVTASGHNDRIDLRIADRGPGIPPAERNRVFEPFQRLSDRDNHTGVGLGLALARGLTEAMNGTLVPDDTPGGGLTMILTLPAAATPAAADAGGAMPGIRPPARRSPAPSAPGTRPPGAEPPHNQPVS